MKKRDKLRLRKLEIERTINDLIESQKEIDIYKAAEDETCMSILIFLYASEFSRSAKNIANFLKLDEDETLQNLKTLENGRLVEYHYRYKQKQYRTTAIASILFKSLGLSKDGIYDELDRGDDS